MRAALQLVSLLGLLVALVPPAAAEPVPVEVQVVVAGFGNYDVNQGAYVLDFYLNFRWDTRAAPPNFTAETFEFANGRATSLELQADETDAQGWRTLYYRVHANLYSDARFDVYPFDEQTVEIRLEDKEKNVTRLVYVAGTADIEESVQFSGWQLEERNFTVGENVLNTEPYPYSQARFAMTLQRNILSGVIKVMVPPVAFVLIAGISFFLIGADKVVTRFGLTTNMAISGIMFHAAQSSSLPSLPSLVLLDRYMLAIHVFLFGSIVVTALVALWEMKWKDPAQAKRLSLAGAIAVPAAAVGVFLLLLLV